MPSYGYYDDGFNRCQRYKKAAGQVRAKFPELIEGTSGWYRAMANRLRRAK